MYFCINFLTVFICGGSFNKDVTSYGYCQPGYGTKLRDGWYVIERCYTIKFFADGAADPFTNYYYFVSDKEDGRKIAFPEAPAIDHKTFSTWDPATIVEQPEADASYNAVYVPDDDVLSEELAKEIGLGYSAFRKRFREYTGMAPLEYQIALRIRRASRLLTSTSIPIAEIAADTGFNTPNYFSRFFRKATGLSPAEFRKSQS